MKTFEEARVGDIVYDIRYGYGKIIDTTNDPFFQLLVDFGEDGKGGTQTEEYTEEGYINVYKVQTFIPMLYWDKPKFIAPVRPLQDMDLVWGWNNEDKFRVLGLYYSWDKTIYPTKDTYDNYELYKGKWPKWAEKVRERYFAKLEMAELKKNKEECR